MKSSLSDSWRLWQLFGMGHSPTTHQNMTSKQVPGQAQRLAPIIVFFDYSGLQSFIAEGMKENEYVVLRGCQKK